MQILKLTVLFIISFISSLLIFVIVLPSGFSITQFIEIEKPKEVVFEVLKDLKERKKWYCIVDSAVTPSIKITGEGDNGSKFSWTHGEVEVVLADIKKMENKIKFIDYPVNAGFMNYKMTTTGTETFEIVEAQKKTTVTWTLSGGPLDYPVGKAIMASVRYKLYYQMEKSLLKLKDYVESALVDIPKEKETPANNQVLQQTQNQEQQNQEQQNQIDQQNDTLQN